jgi:hypothetical protein
MALWSRKWCHCGGYMQALRTVSLGVTRSHFFLVMHWWVHVSLGGRGGGAGGHHGFARVCAVAVHCSTGAGYKSGPCSSSGSCRRSEQV